VMILIVTDESRMRTALRGTQQGKVICNLWLPELDNAVNRRLVELL
jgi:hypothetical protein